MNLKESDPYTTTIKKIQCPCDIYTPIIRTLWSTKIWKAVPVILICIMSLIKSICSTLCARKPSVSRAGFLSLYARPVKKDVYLPIIRTIWSTKIWKEIPCR